jgi:hypothetical protein
VIRNVIHIVASVTLILLGLVFALVLDIESDMRLFGWILAGVGALGLLSRWLIGQLRDGKDARRRLS